MDKIAKQTHESTKKNFDFDKIYEFCNNHKVEVIVQSDHLYHCYIDYVAEDGSMASDIHPLAALVNGIKRFNNR